MMYPIGYGTSLVSMARLREVHEPKMHPEFARRLFPWLESMGGLVGIGGGWRAIQPVKPGFAEPGKSFHESQTFASGFVGYAAVDLVARNPGRIHRAPTWAEGDSAPTYGLHTFIAGEPWHIQCIEMRGWQTWVNAGRPDPHHFVLPGDTPAIPEVETPPPVPPPIFGDDPMIIVQPDDGDVAVFAISGNTATWVQDGEAHTFLRAAGIDVSDVKPINRRAFKALTLLGPSPTYEPHHPPQRTNAQHFAGQLR